MKRIYVEDFFDYKGYKCVCVFNAGGFRCGYVAVDETHPYYKMDYDNEGPNEIMCHWGLTYSGDGRHFYDEVDDILPNNLWWFGFDCGHYGDGMDCDTALQYDLISGVEYEIGIEMQNVMNMDENVIIKTKEFVEEICKMIVEQLIAVRNKEDDNDGTAD